MGMPEYPYEYQVAVVFYILRLTILVKRVEHVTMFPSKVVSTHL